MVNFFVLKMNIYNINSLRLGGKIIKRTTVESMQDDINQNKQNIQTHNTKINNLNTEIEVIRYPKTVFHHNSNNVVYNEIRYFNGDAILISSSSTECIIGFGDNDNVFNITTQNFEFPYKVKLLQSSTSTSYIVNYINSVRFEEYTNTECTIKSSHIVDISKCKIFSFETGIEEINLTNMGELETLILPDTCTRCVLNNCLNLNNIVVTGSNLNVCEINNCPKLSSVDFSNSAKLTTLSIQNTLISYLTLQIRPRELNIGSIKYIILNEIDSRVTTLENTPSDISGHVILNNRTSCYDSKINKPGYALVYSTDTGFYKTIEGVELGALGYNDSGCVEGSNIVISSKLLHLDTYVEEIYTRLNNPILKKAKVCTIWYTTDLTTYSSENTVEIINLCSEYNSTVPNIFSNNSFIKQINIFSDFQDIATQAFANMSGLKTVCFGNIDLYNKALGSRSEYGLENIELKYLSIDYINDTITSTTSDYYINSTGSKYKISESSIESNPDSSIVNGIISSGLVNEENKHISYNLNGVTYTNTNSKMRSLKVYANSTINPSNINVDTLIIDSYTVGQQVMVEPLFNSNTRYVVLTPNAELIYFDSRVTTNIVIMNKEYYNKYSEYDNVYYYSKSLNFEHKNLYVDTETVNAVTSTDKTTLQRIAFSPNVKTISDSALEQCSELLAADLTYVEHIGTKSFGSCSKLQTIDLTNIKTLSQSAFWYNDVLQTITLGPNLENVPMDCFEYSTNIKKIVIKGTGTTISDYAFSRSLRNTIIEFPNKERKDLYHDALKNRFTNSNLVSVVYKGGYTYIESSFPYVNSCTTETIILNTSSTIKGTQTTKINTKIKEVDVWYAPTIGKYTFYNCKGIQSIVLPDNVLNIQERAFENCSSLYSVTASGNGLNIYNYAFNNCSNLKLVNLNGYVLNINDYAFTNCPNLLYVHISTIANTEGYELTLSTSAFDTTNSSLVIEFNNESEYNKYSYSINGIFTYKDVCRYVDSDVESINVTNVKTIILDTYNVSGELNTTNSTINNIIISDKLITLGSFAFYNCRMIGKIVIRGNNLKNIKYKAFANSTLPDRISLPESVVQIENDVFANSKVKYIDLHSTTLTTLGSNAFGSTYLSNSSYTVKDSKLTCFNSDVKNQIANNASTYGINPASKVVLSS